MPWYPEGFTFLKKLIEDSDKAASFALNTDDLREFLSNHYEGTGRYGVSGYFLNFLLLTYDDGRDSIHIAPVYSQKQVSNRKRGDITYSFLSLVVGPDRSSIERLLQESVHEAGLPKILTHSYIVADSRRATETFNEILKQAVQATEGTKGFRIGTTSGLVGLVNDYVAAAPFGESLSMAKNPIIAKENLQLPYL
jgi:hypothetical protein